MERQHMKDYGITTKYYCKDFNDLKKASLDILRVVSEWSNDDALDSSRMLHCSYCETEDGCDEDTCCQECECDGCVLLHHLDDKDVAKNIELELQEDEIDFPCIADVYDGQIDTVSIAKLKSNTKFGSSYSEFY